MADADYSAAGSPHRGPGARDLSSLPVRAGLWQLSEPSPRVSPAHRPDNQQHETRGPGEADSSKGHSGEGCPAAQGPDSPGTREERVLRADQQGWQRDLG